MYLRLSKKYILIYLILVNIVGLLFAQEKDNEWQLVFNKNNIRTYKRQVKNSILDEFKGIGLDNVRIEVIGEVLLDLPGYTNWLEYLIESRIVEKIDDNNMIIYQRFDFKWPFYDRDCVVRINIERNYDMGVFRVNIKSINDPRVPIKEDTVRITDMIGEIIILYMDREHTEGFFSERINFGGNMPNWLANKLNKYIPFRVLTNIRKECRKEKYTESAKVSEIKENIEKSIKEGKLKE